MCFCWEWSFSRLHFVAQWRKVSLFYNLLVVTDIEVGRGNDEDQVMHASVVAYEQVHVLVTVLICRRVPTVSWYCVSVRTWFDKPSILKISLVHLRVFSLSFSVKPTHTHSALVLAQLVQLHKHSNEITCDYQMMSILWGLVGTFCLDWYYYVDAQLQSSKPLIFVLGWRHARFMDWEQVSQNQAEAEWVGNISLVGELRCCIVYVRFVLKHGAINKHNKKHGDVTMQYGIHCKQVSTRPSLSS